MVTTAILKKKGDDSLTSVDDLSGLVLGGVVPPAADTLVFEEHNKALEANGKAVDELLYFQSNGDLFAALASGQVDAAVNASTAIAEFMKAQPGKFEIVGDIGEPLYVAWAVRAEDTQFRDEINSELEKIRDSGKMTELQMKWFGYTMEIPDSGFFPPGAI